MLSSDKSLLPQTFFNLPFSFSPPHASVSAACLHKSNCLVLQVRTPFCDENFVLSKSFTAFAPNARGASDPQTPPTSPRLTPPPPLPRPCSQRIVCAGNVYREVKGLSFNILLKYKPKSLLYIYIWWLYNNSNCDPDFWLTSRMYSENTLAISDVTRHDVPLVVQTVQPNMLTDPFVLKKKKKKH